MLTIVINVFYILLERARLALLFLKLTRHSLTMMISISICAVFWILLTDGAPSSWLLGVPAISLTVWIVHRFPLSKAPLTIHSGALLKFIPWFIQKSIRGGLDVCRVALSRPLSLHPAFFTYECSFVDTRARALFAICLNVLPGTTTVRMDAGTVYIHCLTSVDEARLEIAELEEKISRILTPMKDRYGTDSDSCERTAK